MITEEDLSPEVLEWLEQARDYTKFWDEESIRYAMSMDSITGEEADHIVKVLLSLS